MQGVLEELQDKYYVETFDIDISAREDIKEKHNIKRTPTFVMYDANSKKIAWYDEKMLTVEEIVGIFANHGIILELK